ncbi:MAG: NAD-dependent epimerase/dehydratase family protein [Candidatus Hydrogenedentota bacterium]|nr:MAG: NAD-dependent epimerase/dehydratase family protein [Candidatus Hydrogenedentota bacterium]
MKPREGKILILGAEGFVGSHLAERLPQAVLLDDRSLPKARFERTVVGDIRGDIASLIEGKDLVIHAACRDIRHSMTEPMEDADVNVLGTLNVLIACRKFQVPCFYISSVSVTHEVSHYAVSKSAAERYTLMYRAWVPTCVVRLSNVFGPRDTESVIAKWLVQDEITLVDPSATRDFTFIEDTLDGILKAIEAWPEEVVNIGTGVETSLGSLAEWIAKRLGKPIRRMPPREIDNVIRRVVDPEPAQRLIGYRAKWSLEEGLEETIRWNEKHRIAGGEC